MTKICHLIDDTSPGGVKRFLDFMQSSPLTSQLGKHEILPVSCGVFRAPRPDADVIVSHVVLAWKNLPFLLALRRANPGTPLVHMEHSYSPAFDRLLVKSPRRFHAMLNISLSLFDRVVTICSAQQHWLHTAVGVPTRQMVQIPPCVALDGYLELPAPDTTIRSIGAFGRFDTQKGFDILIPAFRQAGFENVTLDLFGDGPMRADLEALAKGDPNIIFHGFTDDPSSAMSRVDAVAMPSRREPYGLVALEALAAGRPLLVSRVDGLIDHILNGALPVDRLTTQDWCNALQNLPRRTDVQRQQQSRQLASRAAQNLVDGWTSLLADLNV